MVSSCLLSWLSWGDRYKYTMYILLVMSWHGVSLAGVATSIIFVATKVLSRLTHVRVLSQHSMLVATNIFGSDKSFVTDFFVFVATKPFCCCNKHNFVATSLLLSRQNTSFVATKACLWRQACFCRDKRRVLSRQTCVCRDKKYTCGSSH